MSPGVGIGLCFVFYYLTGQNLNPRNGSIGKSSSGNGGHGGEWVVSHCFMSFLALCKGW